MMDDYWRALPGRYEVREDKQVQQLWIEDHERRLLILENKIDRILSRVDKIENNLAKVMVDVGTNYD
jgi:hypothetical protein